MKLKVKGKKSKSSKLPDVKELQTGEFVKLPGGLIIGEVPIKGLRVRKARFRKMDSLQLGALRASIGKLGVKDPITLVQETDGYAIVDGHHRLDEVREQGLKTVPAIILTDRRGKPVDTNEADLSMHRFNLSAHTDGENFLQVLHEMVGDGIPLEDIAEATAKEVSSIEEMVSAFVADLSDEEKSEGDEKAEVKGKYSSATPYGAAEEDEPTHESSRGVPIIISLPGTEDVKDLLERAAKILGTETTPETCVESLRAVAGKAKLEGKIIKKRKKGD
ncbi:MAG: ParB N-terminal domain-containing protein [Alphaproteobacteria bacterium]|nr:ParB N-terminal domain-containing protein [Alphaproteobacteria bacterium]